MLLTTAAVTTDSIITTETPGPNCKVDNRVDCGYRGIQARQCREKGCCWDSKVRGVPWCFYGADTTTAYVTTEEPRPNCNVADPSDRVDCGYPGIHPDTCRKRNCCWDETIRDVPWCFYGKGRTTRAPPVSCDVGAASDRVDCGYPGIHPDTCLERNCCWDESIRDVPWCFFGLSSTTASPTTVTQPPTPQCNVPRKQRKRCGQRGITRKMCIYERCCWETMYGAPSCYQSSAPSCDVQQADRQSCGYIGITETTCTEKGCCWDSSVYGRLKCYRPDTGQSSQLVRL